MAISVANKVLTGILLLSSTMAVSAAQADEAKVETSTTVVATLPKSSSSDSVLDRALDIINESRSAEEKVQRRQNMQPSHPDKVVKEKRMRRDNNRMLILGGEAVMNGLPM